MTRMVKVVIAVAVVILACTLVIGIGSSSAETKNRKGLKLIKIWVDENNGQIRDVRLQKDDGSDLPPDLISPNQPAQFIGTILFYQKNPNCTIIHAGGYAFEVCW